MKYYVEVEGRTISLDFLEENERRLVQVGVQHLTLNLRLASQPSLYSLHIDNRSYKLLVEAQGDEYDVLIGSEMYHLKVQDEWARRLANIQRKTLVETGELAIKAPMPGAVVAVEVSAGEDVKRGQGVVVLSAMKMENEIKSPRAGRVKSVEVQPGQTVEQGRTLVVIVQ